MLNFSGKAPPQGQAAPDLVAARMKEDFKIRRFHKDDAAAVSKLSAAIPELNPWPLSVYECIQEAGFEGWIADCNGTISGFVLTRCVSDEMEILTLGTAQDFRRRGVAAALLTAAFLGAVSGGARRAFLEVRASNAPAISLYQAAGFCLTGRRQNYYTAPVEDALLMTCDLERKTQFPLGG